MAAGRHFEFDPEPKISYGGIVDTHISKLCKKIQVHISYGSKAISNIPLTAGKTEISQINSAVGTNDKKLIRQST